MQYNHYNSDKLSIDTGRNSNLDRRSVSPFPTIPFPEESTYGSISPFPSIPPPAQMEYVTIQGNVIRSVIPPGKGIHVAYGKVNQGYAPRPFNQGQLSPQSGSQRSPGSGTPSWSQPRSVPVVAQNPYATLPRTGSSQGRHSYSSHSSSNAYSANKSHVTFGPNTYNRPAPPQPAYNNVNVYNRGEGQTQNEIQIQSQEPQTKVKHPDHFEDLEVETLNQPPISTRPFTWPPKEEDTKDLAPTATPIYIPPPGTQHVLVKSLQEDVIRKQEEEIQKQQIVQQEHRQIQQQQQTAQTQQKSQVQTHYQQQQISQQVQQCKQQQECQQKQQQQQQQWQIRSAPQLNSNYHVEVESGSDSYTSTSTTTTTTSEEYNRMYQAQVQAYQMQQMYDQSGSEYDYHMEIDQSSARQEHDHSYSMSSDIHSTQSGRRSAQECAENLQSTLSMYKLIDMVREVTPSPTPMNKPRRVEFLDSEEILEEKSQKQESLAVNETVQNVVEKSIVEEKEEESKKGEEERRQSVVEEIIVPQKVSSVGPSEDLRRKIVITPIEESTERLFPPTPEIKIIFPPPLILPPTNIPNPVPKEWINPMVKALTIAPDKPIELHPGIDEYLSSIQEEQTAADQTVESEQTSSTSQPAEYYCSTVECKTTSTIPIDMEKGPCDVQSCGNVCSGPCSKVTTEGPCATCPMSIENICCKEKQSKEKTVQASILKEEPPKGSKISKTLSSVPEYKFKFAPAAGEYIPLPEETEPYMPPPIDMTPYTKEDFRPKSPMLTALITAPNEPYQRFEKEVCSQLLDLPTASEKLRFSDALVTAPDRAYSPLSTENVLKLGLDEPPTKPEYIHLSLEEQKVETEKKVFEQRQESMDRKISAFVSLGDYDLKTQSFQNQSKSDSNEKESKFMTSNLDSQFSCATPRNSLEFPELCELQPPSYFEQKYQHTLLQQSMTEQSTRKQSINQSQTHHHLQSNTETGTSTQRKLSQDGSNVTEPRKQSISDATKTSEQDAQIASLPPISSKNAKRSLLSGLHKPDNIPQYQRNWTVLPSQRPVRTPEPEDLKLNVPLAFVPMPSDRSPSPCPDNKPKQPQIHRSLRSVSPTSMPSSNHYLNVPSSTKTPNAIGEAASSRFVNINDSSTTNIATSSTTTPNVPLIIENRVGPITMTFQSLDDIPDDHSARSGAYTPSFTNKPAPVIPYYQTPEKLVFEECSSIQARPYDRRSASPFPDRTHSPAPGPPPNPLKTIAIHAPRIKENTLSVVPRSPVGGSITTGQSYLGTQLAQQQHEQILSHYQTGMDSNACSFIDKPEIIQERQIGDLHVQTKQKESHLSEEKKSEQETQTKSQIGNMQIERRRKVVEEYEHSQSAKTVEIRTQSQGEKKSQHGKTGFVANQARRLSGLEEEISSLTSQSKAISARAANLGIGSETRFPETKSPTPSNAFPIKPVLPPYDQPKMPTYVVPSPSNSKLAGAPPGFVHRYDQFKSQVPETTMSKSTACAASSISKRSQSLTGASLTFGQKSKLMTSDIPTLTPTAPQHYVGGAITSNFSTSSIASNSNTITSSLTNTTTSRDTQEQNISKFASSTNTYRPTASTGPAGFKPPPPGAIQVLPHPLPTPSSGVTTPKHQPSVSQETRQVIFPPTPEQLIQDDLFKTKQSATAAAATATSNFNTTSMQSAIASSASFASNQTTSSINSTQNIDTKSAADTGAGGKSGGTFSATSAPKRGRGILNKAVGPGSRIPQCGACQNQIRILKIDVTNTCDSPPLPPPPPPEFLEQSLIEGLQDISTLPAPPTPPPSEPIPSLTDNELTTISLSDDNNAIEDNIDKIESTLETSLISIMKPDKNINDSIITKENSSKRENYSTTAVGATEMLANSLDKISVEDKNNFMSEAGKIISNMLEARLTHNNNNKNFESKSPKGTTIKTKTIPKQEKNDNNIIDNENLNTKNLLSSHPMKNILDICDSRTTPIANNNNHSRNISESGQHNKQNNPNNKKIEKLPVTTTTKDDLSVLSEKVTKSPFLTRKKFNNDSKSSTPSTTTNNLRSQTTNNSLLETPVTLRSDTINNVENVEAMKPLESATAVIHRENKKCNRNDSRRLSTQAFDRRSYIEKDNQLMNAINEAVAVATSFQQQLDEHQDKQHYSKTNDNISKNNNENSLNNVKSNINSENFVNNLIASPSSSLSCSTNTTTTATPPTTISNKINGNEVNSSIIGEKVNGSNNGSSLTYKNKKSDVNGGNDSIDDNENKVDTKGLKVYDGKEPIICCDCNKEIKRGPFITALGRIWCPDHFMCVNGSCRRPLQDIGFVEEKGDLYCEFCFEKYLAPTCSKCNGKIKGDCLNAIGKHFHPECFTCAYCGKLFGNTPFFLEDGEPYCEADWNELFTTKCFACGFPVEAGDRWVEALNHNYHSQCFNCTMCKKNLEGQSFYNKGGRPFCKNHAR